MTGPEHYAAAEQILLHSSRRSPRSSGAGTGSAPEFGTPAYRHAEPCSATLASRRSLRLRWQHLIGTDSLFIR